MHEIFLLDDKTTLDGLLTYTLSNMITILKREITLLDDCISLHERLRTVTMRELVKKHNDGLIQSLITTTFTTVESIKKAYYGTSEFNSEEDILSMSMNNFIQWCVGIMVMVSKGNDIFHDDELHSRKIPLTYIVSITVRLTNKVYDLLKKEKENEETINELANQIFTSDIV